MYIIQCYIITVNHKVVATLIHSQIDQICYIKLGSKVKILYEISIFANTN